MSEERGLGGREAHPRHKGVGAKRLFPLPPVHVPTRVHCRSHDSRRATQSETQRVQEALHVNEVVHGLNWLDGAECGKLPANAAQVEVLEAVRSRVRCASKGLPFTTPRAAFDELLRGRSVYTVGQAPVALASFGEGRVSLPDDMSGAPNVEDVLPSHALWFLKDEERMMRCEKELCGLRPDEVPNTLYRCGAFEQPQEV